eukprot:superscaffoldBa00000973_g8282
MWIVYTGGLQPFLLPRLPAYPSGRLGSAASPQIASKAARSRAASPGRLKSRGEPGERRGGAGFGRSIAPVGVDEQPEPTQRWLFSNWPTSPHFLYRQHPRRGTGQDVGGACSFEDSHVTVIVRSSRCVVVGEAALGPIACGYVWGGRRDALCAFECDTEKRTPLHAAAFLGDAEITELLILSGARVNAKDNMWLTPLHRAVASRSE